MLIQRKPSPLETFKELAKKSSRHLPPSLLKGNTSYIYMNSNMIYFNR